MITIRQFWEVMNLDLIMLCLIFSIILFCIVMTRIAGALAISVSFRYFVFFIKTFAYGFLLYFFIKETGIDKPMYPITLFTIVVCAAELFSSFMDIVVFTIESLIEPSKNQFYS